MDSLLQELAAIDKATDYLKTLALLRALKAGTVSLENVTMTPSGWTVAAIAPAPPAEIHLVEDTETEPADE